MLSFACRAIGDVMCRELLQAATRKRWSGLQLLAAPGEVLPGSASLACTDFYFPIGLMVFSVARNSSWRATPLYATCDREWGAFRTAFLGEAVGIR
ncbi:hypothetical protein CMUS01_06694 [Colletotrichum musicola]|uniref:Uncharacterized protein n=1 Tax=Colletotrichum musicola TaxID=2175873 RepID=A0A8H6NGT5_9PEZI|nr:hypothetical protein CMUS01_06694 [Colletotrichum musicola]